MLLQQGFCTDRKFMLSPFDPAPFIHQNFPQKCALIGGGGGAAFWEHLAVETKPKTFILCGMQDAAAAGLLC